MQTNEITTATCCGVSICAPSEWDSSNNKARHQKLLDEGEFYHGNELGYDKFIKLLESFQFWDKTSFKPGEKLWFFHPLAFIGHFRKCGWLSSTELAQIYPDDLYNHKETPDPSVTREKYRISLNQVMRKYLICTPTRITHFLGQGAVESFMLARMMEASTTHFSASLQPETGGYYNNKDDHYFDYLEGRADLGNVDTGDGIKFRGRGMKQLTGRENYAEYWVFRRWLNPSLFDANWWTDKTRRRPDISDPQRVSVIPFNCIDAGGWYWTAGSASNRFTTINSSIRECDISPQAIFNISRAINGLNRSTRQPNGLKERAAHTQRIAKIITDLA